tara:strand:- start:449 stop:787 length:339 start_codon:yes stop_codon:yes gene_type:complete
MTKTGPLSKEEKTYIEDNKDKSADSIAKDLDRSENIVNKHLTTVKPEQEGTEGGEEWSPPKAGEQFARNKKYGATVMTESASMTSDENKQKTPRAIPDRMKDYICEIKRDEK